MRTSRAICSTGGRATRQVIRPLRRGSDHGIVDATPRRAGVIRHGTARYCRKRLREPTGAWREWQPVLSWSGKHPVAGSVTSRDPANAVPGCEISRRAASLRRRDDLVGTTERSVSECASETAGRSSDKHTLVGSWPKSGQHERSCSSVFVAEPAPTEFAYSRWEDVPST